MTVWQHMIFFRLDELFPWPEAEAGELAGMVSALF